jgi:DNA repair exonuclease SbcCD ATPase subunit
MEQTISHSEQLTQTSKLIQQIQQQLQQIQVLQAQYNIAKGSVQQLNPALLSRQMNLLSELQTLVSTENQLMAQSQTYTKTFQQLYPGYAPSQDFGQIYRQLQANTQSAAQPLQQVITATLQNQQNFQAQATKNIAAVNNANTSQSQIAATVAGATLAEQSVEQLQKLQTLDALRGQMEIHYYMESEAAHAQQQAKADNDNKMQWALYNWGQAVCPAGITCPGLSTTTP